jgi:hypothetical protein
MTAMSAFNANNLSAADALIGGRVVMRTRQQYEAKIKAMRRYYIDELGHDFNVPIARDDILAFFGWLIDVKHKDDPLSISSVKQYKSALKWYYKECRLIIDPGVNQELDTLLKGYQRRVSDFKLEGKMPVFEGKYHLPFDGYRTVAALLFRSEPFNQMLFAWPFLILQWNLIARTATVSSMMMEHVGWEGDALLITTPKHKGDQEGVKCFARHLYANPADPALCPVLALAVVTFVRSLRHDPTSNSPGALSSFRIFDGPNNNARFSDTLLRIISAVPTSDVHLLGGEKKQLGTHSVRKGAASYCAGMINGPSTVQVFLRAGWSLGNVQDRYLFAGAGGDQLVGRTLSGLPFNDSTFASLPPHFNQEGARLISWQAILPLYPRLPDCFKQALPHLLASVIHHEDWLRSTLPPHHPLFSSHLFASGTVAALKQHVLTGCGRCLTTGMMATGIPPHLVMTNELTAVVSRTEQLKQALLTRCDELPAEVTNVMLSKLSVNGAIPVTMDNMRDMLDTVITQLRAEIRTQATDTQAMPPLIAPSIDSRFQLWAWGGKLHMVPEGWMFPSTNVKDTWNLWHFGHHADKIRPLRYLKKCDVGSAAQVTVWSKTKGVMQAVSQVIVDMRLVRAMEDVLALNAGDSSTLFDQAIVVLMDKLRAESTRERRRWMEMSVPTLYALVLKDRSRRKRRREEEGVEQEEGRGEEGKQQEEKERGEENEQGRRREEEEEEEEDREEKEERKEVQRDELDEEVDAPGGRRDGEEGEAAVAVALLSQAFGGAM